MRSGKAARCSMLNLKGYDISIELYGSYETDKDEPASPQPAYGKTKSGRKNVKQIQQGLSVSATVASR